MEEDRQNLTKTQGVLLCNFYNPSFRGGVPCGRMPSKNMAALTHGVANMSASEMKAKADASGMSAEEKAAKIGELQKKMAEAKAPRLAGG